MCLFLAGVSLPALVSISNPSQQRLARLTARLGNSRGYFISILSLGPALGTERTLLLLHGGIQSPPVPPSIPFQRECWSLGARWFSAMSVCSALLGYPGKG